MQFRGLDHLDLSEEDLLKAILSRAARQICTAYCRNSSSMKRNWKKTLRNGRQPRSDMIQLARACSVVQRAKVDHVALRWAAAGTIKKEYHYHE